MKNKMLCLGLVVAGGLMAGAAPVAFEVETGTCYHSAVRPATNLVARIDFDNATPAPWRGRLVFRDYFGRTFEVAVAGAGAKGSPLRVRLPEPPAMGLWRGRMESAAGAGGKVCTANFAVLDPHPVTPLKPRGSFRIGLNYHVVRYYPALRHQTMEALVGVGAKLMRGDLAAMCLVQPAEGRFDWTATDTIISELLARGVAIDAIITTVPTWARHPDYCSLTNGPTWVVPTRPGIDATFARTLAARYGTKIEYYEIGNELDLVSAKYLPVEKAIERQRTYYAAIKGACPAAQVIPSGWALATSDNWMVSQKGFQERFMREAQEACDFHPIHIHATYDNFRKEMLKFFAWRDRDGVTIPWYANETAASTCAGQEDSAAMWVWQKPLWAWAHGSSDYIWYNLRSVGPDPENGEHAYGIFTMDLQPRATAAAFSALTAAFEGLSFRQILRDTEACQLYRFAGNGTTALAGWDSLAQAPRTLEIATDAAACTRVDLMGNRTDVSVKNGRAMIELGRLPVCYLFAKATRAVPKAEDLVADAKRMLPEVRVAAVAKHTETAPALVLNTMAHYRGFCDGNAETEHRLWKGPSDLSAKVWIWKPQGETVHARIAVTDNRAIPFTGGKNPTGDHLRVLFNGKTRILTPNAEGAYCFDLAWHAVPGPLTIEIYDDDGEGLDGFLGGTWLLRF